MTERTKVGVLGFGLAGKVFHASLISAEPGLELAAVASSRVSEILERYPKIKVYDAPGKLAADPEIGLVVVATPDSTHASLARMALEAGKHVVVDKPLAMSATQAAELVAFARERNRMLTVFHNRRWDGDFKTVREILRTGALGEIKLAAFCWDRFRPQLTRGWRERSRDPWGALMNLGPHLLDQALLLFGRPRAITADLAMQRQGAFSPDYFAITLHYGTTRVLLSASTLVADPRPRFAIHGAGGSFVKYGVDPQENNLRAGAAVGTPGFGDDPEELHGVLTTLGGGPERIRTEPGDYRPFYSGVAAAIVNGTAPPIDPADAVTGLELMELARRSADEQRTLDLTSERGVSS
ncbi:MAG: oxidoreductase [Sinobacteraceae bacterium]|nr:oxidoreductase [Nevskiaceae bacterium]